MELTPGVRRDGGPDLEAVGQDDDLVARIAAEIQAGGPITFARFMELALYDPRGGYYRAAAARPGRQGDFLTAPETHPIFGAVMANGLVEIWQGLGRPDPFVLREYGAGSGAMAEAILERLAVAAPDLAEALRYQPVEVEPRRLDELDERLGRRGWADRVERIALATLDPIVGVALANEVLDALPTHRVVRRDGRLREVFTDWRDGGFVDIEADPSAPDLGRRLADEGVQLSEGQRGEICLAVDSWVAEAAAGLGRGVLLLIDYGYTADELYDSVRRREGTLLAYVRQRAHGDPYRHVGRQDLTAHVDVTAVERAAARAGLDHLGTTTQAEFLVGLGMERLLREIQDDPATTLEGYLAVRSGVMRLLDPAATGRFRVMGFARGLAAAPPLSGFAYRAPRP